MKSLKFAIALITASSYSSFAQESYSSRDLWYIPSQGQFQVTVNGEYRANSTNVDFPGTPKLQDRSVKGGPALAYGFTDNFVAGVGLSLESKKDESLLTASTKESNTASGLKDPLFAAIYRVLDQKPDSLFLDIIGGLSPSIGKKKDKNVVRGSHAITAGLRIGQQKEAVEYGFTLNLAYFTDEKYSNGDSYKSRFDWGAEADFQYDFNDLISLNAGLSIEFPGDLKVKDGSGSDQKLDFAYGLTVGPEFQITENLSAGATLSYGKLDGSIVSGPDFDVTSFALGGEVEFLF